MELFVKRLLLLLLSSFYLDLSPPNKPFEVFENILTVPYPGLEFPKIDLLFPENILGVTVDGLFPPNRLLDFEFSKRPLLLVSYC